MIDRNNLFAKVNLDDRIFNNIDYVVKLNLNLELCITDTTYLFKRFATIGLVLKKRLEELNVKTIIHLPFYGLELGSADKYIRTLSQKLLIKGIFRALDLGIEKGVMHLGVPPHLSSVATKKWMTNFFETFSDIFEYSVKNNFRLYLENTWERNLVIFDTVFKNFHDDCVAMCLDIAHVHCFSETDFFLWWEKFQPFIQHIHLSDNNFNEDNHMVLGKGSINYLSVLSCLPENLTYTLENDIPDLNHSLDFIERNNLFSSYINRC